MSAHSCDAECVCVNPQTIRYAVRCNDCQSTFFFVLDPADVKRWQGGEMIQNVWPEMAIGDRG